MPDPDRIIVAPAHWAARIQARIDAAGEPAADRRPASLCPDVYQAAAEVVERNRQGRGVVLYILIDNLSPRQMRIFAVMADRPGVRTVACCGDDLPDKRQAAGEQGADALWPLFAPSPPPSILLPAAGTYPAEESRPAPDAASGRPPEADDAQSRSAGREDLGQPESSVADQTIAELTARDIAGALAQHDPETSPAVNRDLSGQPPAESISMPPAEVISTPPGGRAGIQSAASDEMLLTEEELDALLG
ncbi:MAG: hypothetical protein JW810_03585 [Sedimentisphaerales bacterium]|nr:hypothetical protein [Sedimentisphaerales bacterium]